MPELPEVETVVRGLRSQIVGETIDRVEILHPTLIVQGDRKAFLDRLLERTIHDVTRRAKFLCFHLSPRGYLLGHLRMTGKFVVTETELSLDKHQRVRFQFQSGRWLVFSDVRCFGTLEVLNTLEESHALANLGLEPLSLDLGVVQLALLEITMPQPKAVEAVASKQTTVEIASVRGDQSIDFRSRRGHPAHPLRRTHRRVLRDCVAVGGMTGMRPRVHVLGPRLAGQEGAIVSPYD